MFFSISCLTTLAENRRFFDIVAAFSLRFALDNPDRLCYKEAHWAIRIGAHPLKSGTSGTCKSPVFAGETGSPIKPTMARPR
jgi:hypothetical protein